MPRQFGDARLSNRYRSLLLLFTFSSSPLRQTHAPAIFSRDSTRQPTLRRTYVALRAYVLPHRNFLFSPSISGYAPRSRRSSSDHVVAFRARNYADRRTLRRPVLAVPKNHHLRKFMRRRARVRQRTDEPSRILSIGKVRIYGRSYTAFQPLPGW